MLKFEVIGNLGADAEIKNIDGTKFVSMRVAHTEKWKDEKGEVKELTQWVDVTLNNVDHGIIPYLRAGVKIFARGTGSARIYSSKKDRMMKAGLKISAQEIELVGGSSDDVPRQLVEPATGALLDVTKYYWCNGDTSKMKKDDIREVVDTKGNVYLLNKAGFVAPKPAQQEEQTQQE